MKKYEIPSFLNSLGITYFDYGVLNKNKTQVFDYYKTDNLTEKQMSALKEKVKDFRLMTIGSGYAPETKRYALCFPKAGYYRLLKQGIEI